MTSNLQEIWRNAKMSFCPSYLVRAHMSRFFHTALIFPINNVNVAWLPLTHSPTHTHTETSNSSHLWTKSRPRKCFPCSASRTIFSVFLSQNQILSAHWLFWRSVIASRLCGDCTSNPNRCEDQSTRTGITTVCQGLWAPKQSAQEAAP